MYYQEHRLDDALELCRRALDFFGPSPLFTKSVLCQLLLARIHLDRGESAQAKRVCLAALERLAAGGNTRAQLPGLVRARRDRRSAGRARSSLSGLPQGARSPGEPPQPSQGGGNEDRLPQGQAGSLRGTGAHVPGPGPLAGRPRNRLRLCRTGQVAQPGRPDRVSFPGTAGFAEDRARPGGPGQHAARRTQLVSAGRSSCRKAAPPI